MDLTFDIEAAGLDNMKAILNPVGFTKTVNAGLRYASQGFNREAAKQIGTYYSLPARRITKDILKPRITDGEISVTFKRRGPTLRAYGAKPIRGGGMSFQVFKDGGRQTRPPGSTFWIPAKMKNGDETYTDVLLPFRRLGPGRTNITALFGPSIGSIFARDSQYGEQIRKPTIERTQTQFIKGIERELSRQARGY
jgi:hypothetical protein